MNRNPLTRAEMAQLMRPEVQARCAFDSLDPEVLREMLEDPDVAVRFSDGNAAEVDFTHAPKWWFLLREHLVAR